MVGDGVAPDVLAQGGSSQNFLLPNGTFFFEIILFALLFFLFSRFIVPPIRQALADRAERVRQTQRDRAKAEEQYDAAAKRHAEALQEARNSASSIRDEARASARATAEELRADANRDVSALRERGERDLEEQRSRVRSDLHAQLPDLSRTLAERVLGRGLSDEERARSTVEEYVGTLDGSSSRDTVSSGTGSAGTEER